ncbi:hypothetical protein DB30_01675 [Enhygromyxa salina]|uniref:Uncharacterized protein n=1 Tax=Enhygromyxa salina TaxID=215803 RepID=A0A0C2D4R2_9BACT|nr:hypothetical protein [Enhygromyxa salina]KIG18171.1 hypothetical protein DB30_01675 [Enhygromyxa salina]
MSRLARLIPAVTLLVATAGCGEESCTLIDCESTLEVSYGDIVVNEAYSLTINPSGQTLTVTCLSNDPDAEPLPDWLECDANGFEVTGENASGTTISVTVVPLSTQEALIPSALVPLTVDETLQPNGPDCEPVCYRRVGVVAGA